jgi:hypothetical protein
MKHFFNRLFRSDSHATGNGITCRIAQEWIDSNTILSPDEQTQLDRHLQVCRECASIAAFERTLRSVVVPVKMPMVSSNFEARLMTELEMKPGIDLATVAGWVGVYFTLMVLLTPYWGLIVRLVKNLAKADAPRIFLAPIKANPVLDQIFGTLTHKGILESGMALNALLGGIILLGGIVAVRIAWRR